MPIKNALALRDLAGESFVQFPRKLWPERIDAIARRCEEAGFPMRVVQEAERLHTLLKLVGAGFGLAIMPDPLCECLKGVSIRPLVDFSLPAALRLTWLREGSSPLIPGFARAVSAASACRRRGDSSLAIISDPLA